MKDRRARAPRHLAVFLGAFPLLFMLTVPASSQIPYSTNYQGYLTDPQGFRIFKPPTFFPTRNLSFKPAERL